MSASCCQTGGSREQHHHQHQEQGRPIKLTISSNFTSTVFYCALIVFLLIKYMSRRKMKRESFERNLEATLRQNNLKRLPTPPKLPIIGHLHLLRDHPLNPWEGFNVIREQYGDIVSLRMGIHSMVLVSTYELMKEVLIDKGDVFADRPYFPRHDIVFGGDKENSLALCNWDNTHRDRRKFCKRGVVPNKLSARNQLLEKIISDNLKQFIANIGQPGGRTGADCGLDDYRHGGDSQSHLTLIKNDLLFLTGDIFMRFLCSEERSHEDKKYEKFNINCDHIFYDINQCYLLDFMPYLTSLGFGHYYLKQLKGITDYCRYYIDDNIFEPRRLKHLHSSSNEKDEEDDYLDSIIKEQISGSNNMTLEDYKVGLADLLAGHAAVTNILMRLLGHLSLDEEYQDMIYEEASRVNLSVLEESPPLPVTEAALQEAMRLASSPIVPHVARNDTSISGYYVPRGSAVLFNCYNVNLSPNLWDNPREYNPRRFLETLRNNFGGTSYKLRVPKYFIPFSVGPRQCLGYKMVESISIVTTANICLHYKLKANDEQLVKKLLEPKGSIALNPADKCFEFKLYPR